MSAGQQSDTLAFVLGRRWAILLLRHQEVLFVVGGRRLCSQRQLESRVSSRDR